MVIASADASVRPTSNHYETCMWYRERSVPWVQNSMRDGLFAAVAAAALLIVAHNASAQINETTRAEIARMRWQPATNLHLPTSHSVIGELPRFSGLTGAEAIRLRDIVDANGSQAVEADIIDWDTSSEIIFSYNPTGYIRIDDWSDVDPDAMLKAIQANDESANAQRRAKGLAALHTRRWLERPTLHADTNTVSWIIEGGDDQNDRTINAVALKLGRYGFERIVWVTDPQNFNVGSNDLAAAIANHQFDHSYRYADYQPDKDRAAEYGVAGLVAGVLGVKVAKAVGAGAAIVALKKFGVLLVLPLVYAWRRIKARLASCHPRSGAADVSNFAVWYSGGPIRRENPLEKARLIEIRSVGDFMMWFRLASSLSNR